MVLPDGIVFSAGDPAKPQSVVEANQAHAGREATEAATHGETLAYARAAIERGDRLWMAELVPKINAMFSALNQRHPELVEHGGVTANHTVHGLSVTDGETFERDVIKLAEMYWPTDLVKRWYEHRAEEKEAQRLDKIENLKKGLSINPAGYPTPANVPNYQNNTFR